MSDWPDDDDQQQGLRAEERAERSFDDDSITVFSSTRIHEVVMTNGAAAEDSDEGDAHLLDGASSPRPSHSSQGKRREEGQGQRYEEPDGRRETEYENGSSPEHPISLGHASPSKVDISTLHEISLAGETEADDDDDDRGTSDLELGLKSEGTNWGAVVCLLFRSSIGNTLEWYDFALFSYFAPELGDHFFPGDSETVHLLEAFSIFGAAFLMRPFGGLLFGYLGDTYGRVFALRMSILLMAFPTAMVGLIPSYVEIGLVSPLLLLLVRLLQGISVGGEWIGAQIYVMESAPVGRKGLVSGLLALSTMGFLLANGVSALLRAVLSPAQLSAWGFRIPFYSGLLVAVFGCWMRKGMHESPEFAEHQRKAADAGLYAGPQQGLARREEVRCCGRSSFTLTALRDHPLDALTIMGLTAFSSAGYYICWTWLPTLLTTSELRGGTDLVFSKSQAATLNLVALCMHQLWMPLMGWLSDEFGSKRVLQLGTLVMAICAAPLFAVFAAGNMTSVVIAYLVLGFLFAIPQGGLTKILVEQVSDVGSRYTTMGMGYNASTCLLSGTAPLVCTALAAGTLPWTPGVYLSVMGVVTLATASLRLSGPNICSCSSRQKYSRMQQGGDEVPPSRGTRHRRDASGANITQRQTRQTNKRLAQDFEERVQLTALPRRSVDLSLQEEGAFVEHLAELDQLQSVVRDGASLDLEDPSGT